MPHIKGAGIPASGKSPGQNPTGQLGHPGKHKIVTNDQTKSVGAMGSDGFAGDQSKPRGPIAGRV